jgi:hypothetical protein
LPLLSRATLSVNTRIAKVNFSQAALDAKFGVAKYGTRIAGNGRVKGRKHY